MQGEGYTSRQNWDNPERQRNILANHESVSLVGILFNELPRLIPDVVLRSHRIFAWRLVEITHCAWPVSSYFQSSTVGRYYRTSLG